MIIRGLEINLHEGDGLSQNIERDNDFYEAHILDYLRDNLPTQKNVIDIGANIGNHSIYFSKFLYANTVFSFEPVLDNFLLLAKNTARVGNCFALHNWACGDTFKKVQIKLNRQNMGNGTIVDSGDIEVEVRPLDYLAIPDVTLIKIDVEGYERQVLMGAKETILTNRPYMMIEDTTDITDVMESLGYELKQSWPWWNNLWRPL